jgi:hypothetical protein
MWPASSKAPQLEPLATSHCADPEALTMIPGIPGPGANASPHIGVRWRFLRTGAGEAIPRRWIYLEEDRHFAGRGIEIA